MAYGPPIQKAAETGTVKHEKTRVVELFMAGDVSHAKQVIRRFCSDNPCCVTVGETSFVYRGGEEAGFVVGFRNYPRFPSDAHLLRRLAGELGEALRGQLGQDSYMVVDQDGVTTWSTAKDA
jgi:hypothetical protein